MYKRQLYHDATEIITGDMPTPVKYYNSTLRDSYKQVEACLLYTSVIIGEVIFDKIFRNFGLKLLSCVIGAVIYYVVIQIVLKMGLSTDDLKLLTAVVVALFLAIPYWKGKYFNKAKKGAQTNA